MSGSLAKDDNRIAVMGGVSSTNSTVVLPVKIDPTTGRVLVDSSGGNFSDAETPGGAVNGLNVTFTLAHTPSPAASLILTVNGQVLAPAGVDYTLVTATLTLNVAPPTSSTILAWYRY